MSQTDVLGTAGIDTSELSVKMPTTTLVTDVSAEPTSVKALPGVEDNLVLKKLDDIKKKIDDGFSQIANKINEMGLKQSGGRRYTRKKSGRAKKNKGLK